MRRKLIIQPLILVCCLLAGCSASTGKRTLTSAVTGTETTQDDPTAAMSEIERIYIDEYNTQNDSLKHAGNVIEKLGENGYTAIDSANKVDMTNPDRVRQFIKSQEAGKHDNILVFQITDSDGINLLELDTDAGKVSVSRTYYSFQGNRLTGTAGSTFEADYFEYTKEGYLLIEGCWHSPDKYVLSLSKEDEHIALRVEPLDEKCRELCASYLEPVSYDLNNMFIIDWNNDDYGDLDFYDVFDRFYKETYGIDCPYTMSDDLSVSNEYEIPADEFEDVIMRHFSVSSEELRLRCRYDAAKNVYIYRPRGFDEYDYAEVPYPEVTDYEENNDGSVTLTVNAVYPYGNTSKLFSHRVTVSDEDGRIYYLSNEMPGDEEPDLWWHADRLPDAVTESSDDEEDYSWLLPLADHDIFTAEEKAQLETDTLLMDISESVLCRMSAEILQTDS